MDSHHRTTVLGVDPGQSGAFAFLAPDDTLTIVDCPTLKIPVSGKLRSKIDVYKLLQLLQDAADDPLGAPLGIAVVEALHSRPQQSAQSQFALGLAVGIVEMAVAALTVPTHFVPPQVWQKKMGVSSNAAGDTKGSSRARAAELFPKQAHLFARVKDDGRADAALMAAYGRAFC